ncbi:ABC transporter ATP-binding protein [Defluviitalea phaphyphila]|uniref:ABC transporter ATP-binding protein n=1 Tax=Defluviitalea phaphyphila TaxID=1473580 RepID=UPI000731165E|nr:ABC transporter ATP-binding protein [Defluviitalea phaphyphila]
MIQVINLSKKYGNFNAVNNINFTVEKGEILGFLGPNGAGKSTTMNIITGYISATEGTVKVDGFDILEQPQEVKKRIGYLPEIPPLYVDMTVEEYLQFVCKIKKVKASDRKEMLNNIMNAVKINDVKSRLIKNLSKGYKQRVGLAQAMIGDPEVLILDEPTVGLDPKQIIEIRNVIKGLGKKHTIILSSHILSEVSAVCDKVLIINKGEVVAIDTPENLSKKLSQSNRILLRVKGPKKEVLNIIKNIEDISKAQFQGIKEEGTVDILAEGKEEKDIRENIFYALSKKNYPILMMKSIDLTLEEIFLQVTNGQKEDIL